MNRKIVIGLLGAAALATAGVALAEGGRWRHGDGHGRYGGPGAHHEEFGRGGGHGWREGRGERRLERMTAIFDEVDANGDGEITKEEADAARETRFNAIDANADGAVDAEELVAYRLQQRAERRIARLDENNDGVLQIDELPMRTPPFERFDLDENGVVTKTELQAAAGRRGGRWHGPRGRRFDREEPIDETTGDETPANE